MSKDGNFKISVSYHTEKKFLVRSAILPIFDRWANSGSDNYFSSEDEVIRFLKGAYICAALKELNRIFEDSLGLDGKMEEDMYQTITRIIELISEEDF